MQDAPGAMGAAVQLLGRAEVRGITSAKTNAGNI
jgi:hypothetical protein